jgi:hypothetical protein
MNLKKPGMYKLLNDYFIAILIILTHTSESLMRKMISGSLLYII